MNMSSHNYSSSQVTSKYTSSIRDNKHNTEIKREIMALKDPNLITRSRKPVISPNSQ